MKNMKKLLAFFFLLTIFSCENKNNRKYIIRETFKDEKWVKINDNNRKIAVGSDGHEYMGNYTYSSNPVYIHYIDCNLCLSRLNKKP